MEFFDAKYRDICSTVTLQSSKEGFFSTFASSVIDHVGEEWINNVFGRQKSEEDKIRICCSEDRVWKAIQEVLQNISPIYREKSASVARESRLEGDKLFELKDYTKAVEMYSRSLIRSPPLRCDRSVDVGATLPFAFVCRARALHRLQRYEECLVDLRLAMKEGYPDALRYEIYKIMGQCHRGLKEENKAEISFRVAMKIVQDQLTKLDESDRRKGCSHKNDKLMSVLLKEKEEIEKLQAEAKNPATVLEPGISKHERDPLPEITGSPNGKYATASNLITIKRSSEAGRFAVAAEDIRTGSTLVVEKPYASCLIPEMFASHCHHCYSRLRSPIPCKTCSGVAFCSTDCRDKASSTYHGYECRFMALFIGDLHKKIKALEEDQSRSVNFTEKEANYLSIYNLVTHSGMRMNVDYFQRALMAIFQVKCLKKTDYFTDKRVREELSEEETLTAALILRHLQVLQFNAHEIYETVMASGKTESSKSVYVGVGIYPTVALFNHECFPSVTRYFNRKNIVIKAVRPIKKGELVSENYGPIFTKRTLSQRNRELTSRYWFKCCCIACVEDWPLLENLTERDVKLRCPTPDCVGLLEYPKSNGKRDIKPRCRVCFNKVELRKSMEKLRELEELFHRGIKEMTDGSCGAAVPLLIAYLEKMYKIGAPPCREVSLSQEALRTCYAQTGNIWLCD